MGTPWRTIDFKLRFDERRCVTLGVNGRCIFFHSTIFGIYERRVNNVAV